MEGTSPFAGADENVWSRATQARGASAAARWGSARPRVTSGYIRNAAAPVEAPARGGRARYFFPRFRGGAAW